MGVALYWLLGLLVGTAIALQSTVNAVLTRGVGLAPTVFLVHLTGAIALVVPLWLFRQQSHWGAWNTVPWYAYAGGVLGVVIVSGVTYLVGKIGVTASLTLVIASQLIVAMLIDHLGLFGAEMRPVGLLKVVGVVLLIVGTRLVLR